MTTQTVSVFEVQLVNPVTGLESSVRVEASSPEEARALVSQHGVTGTVRLVEVRQAAAPVRTPVIHAPEKRKALTGRGVLMAFIAIAVLFVSVVFICGGLSDPFGPFGEHSPFK